MNFPYGPFFSLKRPPHIGQILSSVFAIPLLVDSEIKFFPVLTRPRAEHSLHKPKLTRFNPPYERKCHPEIIIKNVLDNIEPHSIGAFLLPDKYSAI